ncbi:SURF1 family protein [Isoptericola sp. NEAU-Y5]|uniref:SURF1-like protein n=1 Tax=Isoptericola luteus TaxID=2879484 RepID=A0ABS7ZE83_9MICO|nr:SURF1 family protein [Isoptericola sp. NEAU-Y5]MCA5892596.1 SURF1 family protein [Isoptericola sp. NEAU-Y5]
MSSPQPVRRPLWAVAVQPRMIGILLVFLLAAAVCARLGVWQLDRAYQRAELAAQQEAAEALAQGPAALGELLRPQESFPGELVGREVWATGTYEAADQLLVAGRSLDGRQGYLVLTPLRVVDDGTGGASWADLSGAPVLPVVRGWVPTPSAAGEVLDVPGGEVRVSGWLQASESVQEGVEPLPDNLDGPPLVDSIATGALVNTWGGPTYTGYVVLTGSDPAQVAAAGGGPEPLPRPVIEGSEGVNLQNLFYALQWWVFGLFAVLLWVRLVRDEAAGGRRGHRGDDADDAVGRGIAGLPG